MRMTFPAVLIASAALLLGGCAGMPGYEPVQVTVADIESIPSEDLEVRMLVKLRVQNPNDTPLEFDGASLKLEVQGRTFASGVADVRGTVPRFGEALVSVPVTASTLNLIMSALGMLANEQMPEKVTYRMDGRLHGPMFGSTSFESVGELKVPKSIAAPPVPK